MMDDFCNNGCHLTFSGGTINELLERRNESAARKAGGAPERRPRIQQLGHDGAARDAASLEGLGSSWPWGKMDHNDAWTTRSSYRKLVSFGVHNKRMAQIMKAVRNMLDSTIIFSLMLAWLVAYFGAHMWPASWWLDVKSVGVGPSQAGAPVPMTVDRTIHRGFDGEWVVTVRRWQEGGGWYVFCAGAGKANYLPGAELPAKLTLDWWTNGACNQLPAGRYSVSTSWLIYPPVSLLPSKQVTIDSNPFEVTP
jgi:hypothetical protein